MAAIRDDGSVEIRQVDGGSAVAQVRGHGAPVIEARFSGDGKQLVTVDAAGGVIVTDMQADGGLREAAHAVSDPGNLHPVVWNDVTRDAWRLGGALERWLSPVSSAARIHNASAVAPVLARGARSRARHDVPRLRRLPTDGRRAGRQVHDGLAGG